MEVELSAPLNGMDFLKLLWMTNRIIPRITSLQTFVLKISHSDIEIKNSLIYDKIRDTGLLMST